VETGGDREETVRRTGRRVLCAVCGRSRPLALTHSSAAFMNILCAACILYAVLLTHMHSSAAFRFGIVVLCAACILERSLVDAHT
jgi:hypothetical protein